MPAGKVRVTGSGYSTFVYAGKPIAFLNSVEDSGQRAWSDKGQAYAFIQPLGARTPVEIATSRVLGGGTLQLTIQPDLGPAGRPSSERIVRAVSG